MRERPVKVLPFQFEWDDVKADGNARKHGVSFELASTLFHDPRLLTVADLQHSETEERCLRGLCQQWGRVVRSLPLVRRRPRSD